MNLISEKFNNKISALKNSAISNKNIIHQGIKGRLNEEELYDLIKEVISSRYKFGTGAIINSHGNQSNETDIFIYDDSILPTYVKNTVTFAPIEAIKYVFEVKTTLNPNEIKTSIKKFRNLISIGCNSPRVLFSFFSNLKKSNNSELERYEKYDDLFFTNPAVTVLCISNKAYYFFETTEHYLKDFVKVDDVMHQLGCGIDDINKFSIAIDDLLKDDITLGNMTRSQLMLLIKSSLQIDNLKRREFDKCDNFKINGFDFNKIKFKIHKWIGVEAENNNVELSFLSGISNTLSHSSFGNYLINDKIKGNIYTVCYEDMWGNISFKEFYPEGLECDLKLDKYNLILNESHKELKLIISKHSKP